MFSMKAKRDEVSWGRALWLLGLSVGLSAVFLVALPGMLMSSERYWFEKVVAGVALLLSLGNVVWWGVTLRRILRAERSGDA